MEDLTILKIKDVQNQFNRGNNGEARQYQRFLWRIIWDPENLKGYTDRWSSYRTCKNKESSNLFRNWFLLVRYKDEFVEATFYQDSFKTGDE